MGRIDLNGKTVLITGAAGFIGAALAERMLSDVSDIRIIGVDDMNDYYDPALKRARLRRVEEAAKGVLLRRKVVEEPAREYTT